MGTSPARPGRRAGAWPGLGAEAWGGGAPPGTVRLEDPLSIVLDDRGGYIPKGKSTPVRIAGTRFGFAGALCYRCYGTLDMRQRRSARRKAAEV